MKKMVITYLIAVSSLFILVAGCQTKRHDKLIFWKFADTMVDSLLYRYVDMWNDNEMGMEVALYTFPWSDYVGTKLTASFVSGAGPDIFWISAGDFMKIVNNEIAYALDDYFTPEIREDFVPAALASVVVDGHIYGIPIDREPVALYYNKELFEEYQVAEPETWEELIEVASRLKTKNRNGLVIETAPGYYQNFTWYPFLWQTGADVLDTETREVMINSEGGIQALELWGDLINKHGIAPKSLTGGANQIDILASGLTAMQECGFWGVKQLQQGFPDFDFGVCPLPIPKGGKPRTVFGGWSQIVNAYSPVREEAARFTMWLWAENVDLSVQWCTVINAKLPARKSVLHAAKSFFDQWPNNIFRDEIIPTASSEPRFPPEIVRIIEEALQEVMFSGTSARDAAENAEKKITDFLKNYRGKL